jgi:hypothetical protein
MAAHKYSNTASEAQLTGAIDGSVTAMSLSSFAGWPVAPCWAIVDRNTETEEIVEVTAIVGSTLTIARGQGGTSAASHAAGAIVEHIIPAAMAQDAEAHQAASTGVHGTSGSVVGTSGSQSLADKLYRGGHTHTFSDANPAGLTAGYTSIADSPLSRHGFSHQATGGDANARAFHASQAGADRFEVFNDGTVEVTPAGGSTRDGFHNAGTSQFDGTATFSGDLVAESGVDVTGGITADSGTVSGTWTPTKEEIPLPASDTSTRLIVRTRNAGNARESFDQDANVIERLNGLGLYYSKGGLDTDGNLTVDGSMSVAAGKIASYQRSDMSYGVRSNMTVSVDGSNTAQDRDLRQALVHNVAQETINLQIANTTGFVERYTFNFTPKTQCHMGTHLSVVFNSDPSGAGTTISYEPAIVRFGFDVRRASDDALVATDSRPYYATTGGSDHWDKILNATIGIHMVLPSALDAGTTYKLKLMAQRQTALAPRLFSILGWIEEVALVE